MKASECWYLLKEMFFPVKPQWEKLTFTQEAWMKLMCYINLIGEFEITGFGRVVDNRIVDVKILKQTVKASTVDCNLDSMQKFLMSIPKEETGQWILDWHSHVNMAVFASGTDSANYIEQYKARMRTQYPLMIVNKKQEYYAKCYISPGRQTDLEIAIETGDVTEERLAEIYEECKKDIEELCEKYTYTTVETKNKTTYPYSNYNWGSWYDQDDDDNYKWQNNSNYIDLQNCKKKGLAKKQENYYGEQLNLVDDNTEVEDDIKCVSCSLELTTDEELERGICEDCWEQMTPSERTAWILNLK